MTSKRRRLSNTRAPIATATPTPTANTRVDSIVDSPGSTIDPVEKLLHLPCFSNDILESNNNTVTVNNITYSHTPSNYHQNNSHQTRIRQLILDRMRSGKGNFFDNLSFAILTKPQQSTLEDEEIQRANKKAKPSRETPFFRNVNFNSRSTTFDEYFSYDLFEENEDGKIDTALPMTPSRSSNGDEDEDPISSPPISYSPSSSAQDDDVKKEDLFTSNFNNNDNNNNNGVSPFSMAPKMRFDYRQKIDELLNLSLSASTTTNNSIATAHARNSGAGVDVWKCLNNTCLLSGKASEMLGSGNIVLTDFLL